MGNPANDIGANDTVANRWPHGAYLTVRALPDEWAAIVAFQGAVLGRVTCSSRASAFDLAISYATKHGLPCLVQRGRND